MGFFKDMFGDVIDNGKVAVAFTDGRFQMLQNTGIDIDKLSAGERIKIMDRTLELMKEIPNTDKIPGAGAACTMMAVVDLSESWPELSISRTKALFLPNSTYTL